MMPGSSFGLLHKIGYRSSECQCDALQAIDRWSALALFNVADSGFLS